MVLKLSKLWRDGATKAASTFSSAEVETKRVVDTSKYWKSATHKEMTILHARRELVDKLYQRYGYRKALETRLIGNPEIQNFCKVWAAFFVERYPNQWHEFLTVNHVPAEVMETTEFKAIMRNDTAPEPRWLLQQICKTVDEDHVPYPKYPDFLGTKEFPKWPYNPYEAEWMQDNYGLLKYPFLRRSKRDRGRGNFTGQKLWETELTSNRKPEPFV